jgi:hypothetical protein
MVCFLVSTTWHCRSLLPACGWLLPPAVPQHWIIPRAACLARLLVIKVACFGVLCAWGVGLVANEQGSLVLVGFKAVLGLRYEAVGALVAQSCQAVLCWGVESPGTCAVCIAKVGLSHWLKVHYEVQLLKHLSVSTGMPVTVLTACTTVHSYALVRLSRGVVYVLSKGI